MSYVRISIMHPREQHRAALETLQECLLAHLKTLPGFLDGYLMLTTDGTGRIGRMTVWKSRQHANHAELEAPVLATRSHMTPLIADEADIHLEQGFESTRMAA